MTLNYQGEVKLAPAAEPTPSLKKNKKSKKNHEDVASDTPKKSKKNPEADSPQKSKKKSESGATNGSPKKAGLITN